MGLNEIGTIAPQLEILGAVFGVCGAWVIAAGPRTAFYGFCCYLVSNVAWLGFAAYHAHWWQFTQQVFFFGSTLLGLWKWGRLNAFLAQPHTKPSPAPIADRAPT
jgi:hypothetical protein